MTDYSKLNFGEAILERFKEFLMKLISIKVAFIIYLTVRLGDKIVSSWQNLATFLIFALIAFGMRAWEKKLASQIIDKLS